MRRTRPAKPPVSDLGRRERQILDTVYRLGRATVTEVRDQLPDPPSYSAVRGMLNLLEEKGHLRHVADGLRYVYLPVVAPADARRSAMAHVVKTFFGGSTADAASALFELPDRKLSRDEVTELSRRIARALKEGRYLPWPLPSSSSSVAHSSSCPSAGSPVFCFGGGRRRSGRPSGRASSAPCWRSRSCPPSRPNGECPSGPRVKSSAHPWHRRIRRAWRRR